MATQAINLPDHVDPSIVRHVDLFDRVLRHDNPFETIIPEIHRGPAVFYADNVMFQQPGWVVRRNADLRPIYADKDHFVKRANSGFAALIGEDWNIIPTETDPPEHTAYRAALNGQGAGDAGFHAHRHRPGRRRARHRQPGAGRP